MRLRRLRLGLCSVRVNFSVCFSRSFGVVPCVMYNPSVFDLQLIGALVLILCSCKVLHCESFSGHWMEFRFSSEDKTVALFSFWLIGALGSFITLHLILKLYQYFRPDKVSSSRRDPNLFVSNVPIWARSPKRSASGAPKRSEFIECESEESAFEESDLKGLSLLVEQVVDVNERTFRRAEAMLDEDGFQSVQCQEEPFIHVERRDTEVPQYQGLAQLRMTCRIPDALPAEVFHKLAVQPEHEWNEVCKLSRVVSPEKSPLLSSLSLQNIFLHKAEFQGLGPVKGRQLLQWRRVVKDREHSLFMVSHTSDLVEVFPGVEDLIAPDLVLAFQHIGFWEISPWVSSGVLKGTQFRVCSVMDPKGFIPKSLVNALGWRATTTVLRCLTKALEEDREKESEQTVHLESRVDEEHGDQPLHSLKTLHVGRTLSRGFSVNYESEELA